MNSAVQIREGRSRLTSFYGMLITTLFLCLMQFSYGMSGCAPKELSETCCNGKPLGEREMCCDGVVQPGPSPGSRYGYACCGKESYIQYGNICCGATIHNVGIGNPDEKECCGDEVIETKGRGRQLCCDGVPNPGWSGGRYPYVCCGKTSFIQYGSVCCGSTVHFVGWGEEAMNKKCCGDELVNISSSCR